MVWFLRAFEAEIYFFLAYVSMWLADDSTRLLVTKRDFTHYFMESHIIFSDTRVRSKFVECREWGRNFATFKILFLFKISLKIICDSKSFGSTSFRYPKSPNINLFATKSPVTTFNKTQWPIFLFPFLSHEGFQTCLHPKPSCISNLGWKENYMTPDNTM